MEKITTEWLILWSLGFCWSFCQVSLVGDMRPYRICLMWEEQWTDAFLASSVIYNLDPEGGWKFGYAKRN